MLKPGKAVRYLTSTALVAGLSMGGAAAVNGAAAQGTATNMNCDQMQNRLDAAVSDADGLNDEKRARVRTLLNEAEQANDRQGCIDKLRQANDIMRDETGEAVILALVESGQDGAAQGSANGATARTADGGKVVVEQKQPEVQVDPKDPEVDVTQRAPEVTVTQPKPEITVSQQKPTVDVRQPAPEITVTQAQPEVTVRIPEPKVEITMPEPDVNVDTQQPDVQVSQPKPEIRFVRPEPKIVFQDADAQVDVEKAQASVDVQTTEDAEKNVQVSEAQPEVSYDAEQARAEVNVSQAEPKITVNKAGEADVSVEQDRARVQITRATQGQDARGQDARGQDGQQARNQQSRDQRSGEQQARGDDLATAGDTGGRVTTGDVAPDELARDEAMGDSTLEQTAENAGQAAEGAAEETGEAVGRAAEETGEALGVSAEDEAGPQVAAMREHPLYDEQVNTIVESDVYGASGDDVGEVEDVAVAGNRLFAIVEVGGFLGLGEHDVAIPLDRLSYANDRIVLYNLTEEELEQMPEFNEGDYASLDRNGTIGEGYESR